MSFLFNDHSPTANNSVQPFGVSYTNKPEGTHAENFKAAFGMFTTNETTWSPAIAMEEIWQPIVDVMNEREKIGNWYLDLRMIEKYLVP